MSLRIRPGTRACSARSLSVILAFAVVVVAGCGPKGPLTIPVRGEVWYQGAALQNVPQGLVRYVPKSPDVGRQASGRIQPDGSFRLTTFQEGDGVVPGEYNISVTAYSSQAPTREQLESAAGAVPGPKRMIPEKYSDPLKSELTDSVDAKHPGFKRLELTK
ncbi:MAG: lipoprotein [Pirellulales bacterium]|nr:lipoprotein [Pirellulales bacterium]